jgi:hypothetical protein
MTGTEGERVEQVTGGSLKVQMEEVHPTSGSTALAWMIGQLWPAEAVEEDPADPPPVVAMAVKVDSLVLAGATVTV